MLCWRKILETKLQKHLQFFCASVHFVSFLRSARTLEPCPVAVLDPSRTSQRDPEAWSVASWQNYVKLCQAATDMTVGNFKTSAQQEKLWNVEISGSPMTAYENVWKPWKFRLWFFVCFRMFHGFPDPDPCLVVLGSTALQVQGLFLPVPQH